MSGSCPLIAEEIPQSSRVFRVVDATVNRNTNLVLKTSPHAIQSMQVQSPRNHALNTFRTVFTGCIAPMNPSSVDALVFHADSSRQSSSSSSSSSTEEELPAQRISGNACFSQAQNSSTACTFHCAMIHAEWSVLSQLLPHRNIVTVYERFSSISGVLPDNAKKTSSISETKILNSSSNNHHNHCSTTSTSSEIRTCGEQKKSNNSCCALLMEEAEMDLFDFVEKHYWRNRRANVNRVIDLFRQIALGLDFLHCQNFAHNDIKSENILLFSNARVAKITDFGLATSTKHRGDTMHATTSIAAEQVERWKCRCLSHAAPEIIETLRSNSSKKTTTGFDEQKADVFAFGVALFESIFGMKPIDVEATAKDAMYKHFVNKKTFTQFWKTNPQIQAILYEISNGELQIVHLFDLLQRSLTSNPNSRLTSAELLVHPLFD